MSGEFGEGFGDRDFEVIGIFLKPLHDDSNFMGDGKKLIHVILVNRMSGPFYV